MVSLQDHKAAVKQVLIPNAIDRAHAPAFFVSVSDDLTAKVWDFTYLDSIQRDITSHAIDTI